MPISTTLRTTARVGTLAVCATWLSLACGATASRAEAVRRQPAQRTYDSHVYYVLELDEARSQAAEWTPEEIAEALGAEHVEQVGELKGHYLIRAEAGQVEAGEQAWTAAPVTDQSHVRPRSYAGLGGGQRDKVLERYDLLRRQALLPPPSSQRKRSSAGHPHARLIRSLERQQPRMRVKRDLPVLPPTADESLPYVPRRRAPISSLVRDAAMKFSIFDPLWPKQWHLVNDVQRSNSINVTGVWEQGVVGTGVNVAIVDDGLDMHSDDLASNFHADGSWDYNDHTALPEPRLSDDLHGTRCAGEIAAVKNDVCGVGVAHGAGVAGIRILSASITDADEASSLNYGYQTNDIYSCSWGPPDDGKSMEAPGRLIVKAMVNGVQNGRQGKGSIFVFASGNGGAVDDQCNFDGYTNSLMSITVGAIDRKGLHPFYSEACSANMVVTYSSGSGDNIHTTDVGKNACTDRHGGTSAAAPIAAGIFALVLEVRPDLTWRDMQHLCVRTAVQINPQDPDWQMTASGRPYNHKYGFGKLDAWAIVEAAKTWNLVKPQAWWQSPLALADPTGDAQGKAVTPDGATAEIVVTAAEVQAANLEKLEHVTITVHVQHERRGNIEVELVSPRGMKSILARPRRFDEDPSGMDGWVFMSVKHWDEDPTGTWTLRVRDRQNNGKRGFFKGYSLALWGSAIDASIAKPYQLPGENDEDETDSSATSTAEPVPSSTMPAVAVGTTKTETTKAHPKPTAHLPDDHADATGEAHSSFGEDYHTPSPTETGAAGEQLDNAGAPTSTAASDSLYDAKPGYLAGVSALVGSTTWLFVAAGVVIIFVAGATAFFILRRRSARRADAGRGGYAFAPATDFEDYDEEEDELVPMSAMDRGRVRLGGGRGRTRELFNAFALDSDDERSSDDERGNARTAGSARGARASADEPEEAEKDLLVDEEDSETTAAARERQAREEFSD